MRIIKKLIRGLAAYGLRASLFGLAVVLALLVIFGSPNPIKQALKESGLYETPLTDLVISSELTARGEGQGEEADTISIDDPLVQASVDEALPKERKQQVVEEVVDGTYAWLDGSAPAPAFAIDFTEDKNTFVSTLATSVFSRVEQLPACTSSQLTTIQEFDPFTVECRPPIDLSAEKDKYIAELQTNDEFFSNPQFNGEQVLEEFSRHDSVGVAQAAPVAFKWFKLAPYILGAVILLNGLLVFFLADSRQKAIKKLGKILLETGLSLVVTGVVLYFVTNGIKAGLASGENVALNGIVTAAIDSLRSQATPPWIYFTGLYALAGGLLLVYKHKKWPAAPKPGSNKLGSSISSETTQPNSSLPPEMAKKIAEAKKNPDTHTTND